MGFTVKFTIYWTVANEVNDRRYSGIATSVVNCLVLIISMAVSALLSFFSAETNARNIYKAK